MKKAIHVMNYRTALVQLPLVRDTPLSIVRTPQEVAAICSDMTDLAQESFHVLVINSKNRLLARCLVSIGTLDSTLVHARDVFRQAIIEHGAAVILAHNHPSGDPTPSAEDVRITRQLISAGEILQIKVLDHVIIGRKKDIHPGYLSMRESGVCTFTSSP